MKVHYTEPYLLNPQHPITVKVVGVGGTGSHILAGLAAMDYNLRALGHMGLSVIAYDPDDVSITNPGRQKFLPSDISRNKATVLIERINRSYGTHWGSVPAKYDQLAVSSRGCNILITCPDKGKTRKEIAGWMNTLNTKKQYEPFDHFFYWLDIGNAKNTGQIVLGSREIAQPTSQYETVKRLSNIVDLYPNLASFDKDDQGPSCSSMEALNRQGLYINTLMATFGLDLLWTLLRESRIFSNGLYYNGDTKQLNPIML